VVRISRSPSPFFGPGGPHRVGLFFGPRGGGPFVVFFVLLLLVAAVVLVVLFVRQGKMRRQGRLFSVEGASTTYGALRILDERFAKGEIDAEDYKVRRDLLRDTP
jgi:uncharacterized membrane protein